MKKELIDLLSIFSASETTELSADLKTAKRSVRDALDKMGVFQQVERSERIAVFEGRSAYGVQSVPMRIKLEAAGPAATLLQVRAKCSDVRSIAAKKCIKRFMEIYTAIQENDAARLRAIDASTVHELTTGFTRKKLAWLAGGFLLFIILLNLALGNFVREWFR